MNLVVPCFSKAMVNKRLINDLKTNWGEYSKNQQAAEAFIKKTSQAALDDILAGDFDAKAIIEKIKNVPAEVWPYVSEESLTLLAKNIRRNVNIEDYYSKEFIADLQALLDLPFEFFGKNNFFYPLKNGFFNVHSNQALKCKLLDLVVNTKERLLSLLETCRSFKQDSPNTMTLFGEVDKETTTLIDLLVCNAKDISDLCLSDEFKAQCSKLLDNRYKMTKIVKAVTFRFISETMLDDALNRPRGQFNPVETIAFKLISSY